MKAVVLAAGRGTRVLPLTRQLAKPMVPVLGRPVLELLVEHLRRCGVDEIVINTSYRSGDIEGYFGDGGRHGVAMAYSFEGYLADGQLVDRPVGSAGALRKIQEETGFLDETFLVLCGDAIVDLDVDRLVNRHRQRRALATIALHAVTRPRVANYGVVVAGADGRVLDFQEKPAPEAARSTTVNTGIYVFEPEVIEHIPRGVPYDIGSQLFPDLVARGARLFGANLPFQWLDIGRLSDYYDVVQLALTGRVAGLEAPGRQIAPGIRVGLNARIDPATTWLEPPVYVGPGAVVESGCRIEGPTAIGRGCRVESGAAVERSVLFEYTRVGSNATVREAIVCAGFCVDRTGAMVDLARSDVEWILGDARQPARALTAPQRELLDLMLAQGAALAVRAHAA